MTRSLILPSKEGVSDFFFSLFMSAIEGLVSVLSSRFVLLSNQHSEVESLFALSFPLVLQTLPREIPLEVRPVFPSCSLLDPFLFPLPLVTF